MRARATGASSTDGRAGADARRQLLHGLAALVDSRGAAPVDEDEERRLAGTTPTRDRDWDWTAELLVQDGRELAYVGTRTALDGRVRLDVTLARDGGAASMAATLERILAGIDRSAGRDGTDGSASGPVAPELWLRGVGAGELELAAAHGLIVLRRLEVLGVLAAAIPPPQDVPAGIVVAFSTHADDAAVGALLSATYPLADGGWDDEGLAVRRASSWFRRDDVLLARPSDGADGPAASRPLLGLHWMKRRSASVGEVHNLAVHPQHQGRGIGPTLLDAGLAHLVSTGCEEVLLWVDADNGSALDLYRSRGFTPRWTDVALRRDAG
jgi:mycothiol synthase